MCRILLVILHTLLICSLANAQNTNVYDTILLDSIADAKIQQILDNKIEKTVEVVARKTYIQHDDEMKNRYDWVGILIAIACVYITVAGALIPYLVNRYHIHRMDNKENEIIKHYNLAQATLLYMLAKETKDISKRIELCKKAIEYNPSYFLAYKLLGRSYFLIEDFDNAINYYRMALDIDIDDEIYVNRALSYSKNNQADKAITDYNSAIAINPNNDKAYYNKAVKLLRMGKAEEAGPIIEKAKDLKRYPQYYELSCLINEKIGNNVAALKDAEIGLNIIQHEEKTLANFFIKKIDELKGKL